MKGKRRCHHGANDSFDLFLDTITNTFGGVLLLALLLVLMIRETAEVETELDSGLSRSELEQQIEQLASERQNLEVTAKIQENLFSDLESVEAGKTADEISEMTTQSNQLETKKIDLERKLKALQQQSKTIQTEMAQLESSVPKKRSEVEIKLKQIGEIEKKQTRTISAPRERLSKSKRTFVLIKQNRLFFLDNESHFRKIATKDGADLILDEGISGTNQYMKSIVSQGLTTDSTMLKKEFQKLGSDFFIWFFVAPDSFDEFSKVRATCVNAGLSYKVDAVEKGEAVVLVVGSGPIKIQ